MKQRALIVGINYVGTSYQLKGCINDANNMKALLESKGFTDIELMLEKDATTAGILAGLKRLVDGAVPGDVLVFHYSGHGSQLYSNLEPDMLDEIICPVDLDWREKVIKDDDLKNIFNAVPNGVNITVVLDCCHSGTALDQKESATVSTTISDKGLPKVKVTKKSIKKRYLAPPSDIQTDIVDHNLKIRDWSTSRDINQTALLIAGCHSNETSADATIGGKAQGAATAALISAVKSNPDITYQGILDSMTEFMITNGFTQRPELDGSPALYSRKFLESWADAAALQPAEPSEPVVTEPANKPTNFAKYLGLTALACAVILAVVLLV